MPDTMLYTLDAAMTKAGIVKLNLALSKLRLFRAPLIISQYTAKAELVAAECDFDGYTALGYTLTAWTGPLFAGSGGAIIMSPLVQLAFSGPSVPPITNMVAGWWIEDAAGNVRLVGTYGPHRSMAQVGDGWPQAIQIVEGYNLSVGLPV